MRHCAYRFYCYFVRWRFADTAAANNEYDGNSATTDNEINKERTELVDSTAIFKQTEKRTHTNTLHENILAVKSVS